MRNVPGQVYGRESTSAQTRDTEWVVEDKGEEYSRVSSRIKSKSIV